MVQEKEIYIVLTDTGTWFTRAIKLVTNAHLNHASLALDRGLNEVYSFGRKNPNNPFFGGFVRENMSGKLFSQAACAIYKCSVSAQTYARIRQSILHMEQNQDQYKYNLLGLFAVMLNFHWKREYAYFCSQFVAYTLMNAGIPISDKPATLVTPADFEDAPQLQLVYRGELTQYLARHAKPAQPAARRRISPFEGTMPLSRTAP